MENSGQIQKAAKNIEDFFNLPAENFSVVLPLGYGTFLMVDNMGYYFVADQIGACSIENELDKCSSYRRVEYKNGKFAAIN